ncbi:MarR family winged helix-turn-helix transcriptional regulator [Sulfitobacter guttiformis]|uniref:DNA-binding MarR family transcriptional regulator n=1 Tax=Sulfitobacter guttiformis TaxID=74349 RepID=A0A420DT63_9RHOB|nr:MarR family winged helix-turn-helix transcriptional regulator [Sulfitobacter guttiformis]KIN71030.1 Sugar-specific transcriptional regulator TrmB family [Sulfitobacter guttiformis KCTC 32187]RKE97514.1 DNA-binding MarR family transcriptional regulator [Sulfitobacter guttiformis]
MAGPQTAHDQNFGIHDAEQRPAMLEAKLWDNPCPFTFRLNYLALLYNTPLYTWIQDTYGLKRPEYVVIYSLALTDGGSARDISETSGFPKNTLSRAIKRLELMGMIEAREKAPGGRRKQALRLSAKGRKLFNETRPTFEAMERRMLTTLSEGERQMLFELMSKVVLGAQDWAGELPAQTQFATPELHKGEPQ